jgi:hypothetical protein
MAITKERFYVRTDVCLAETGALDMQDLDYACGSRRCQGVSASMPSAAIAASFIGISAVVFAGTMACAARAGKSRATARTHLDGSRIKS